MAQTAPLLGLGEFFGEPVRRRQILGFAVVENRFDPGRTIPPHRHAHSHLTCVLEGGFRETYVDQVLECPSRSMLIVPRGRIHEDCIGPEGAHTISIEIGPRTLGKLLDPAPVLNDPRVVSGPIVQRTIERLQCEFRANDDASLLAIAALTLELLVAAERASRSGRESKRPWMDAVLAEIHADPAAGASLGALAARHGVHEAQLARSFRRRNGCSLGEYVRWLRLEGAKQALLETDATLSHIACEAGFYDQAHFTRAFRKIYGIAPSEYRKAMRGGSPST